MQRQFGRLLAICGALVLLLAALAAVQYRWATRVAAADAQREREHLETSASLFANEFNDEATKAFSVLQNDVQNAVKSGEPVTGIPRMIREVYYLDVPAQGIARVKRLGTNGLFTDAPVPPWLPAARCAPAVVEQRPLVLISPVFDITNFEKDGTHGVRVMRTLSTDRCIVARIDDQYLTATRIPELIKKSFGETSWNEYDFAVVPRDRPAEPAYGAVVKPDVSKAFFSMSPLRFGPPRPRAVQDASGAPKKTTVFLQRYESTVITRGAMPENLAFGEGIWQLDVAHKGVPLAAAFERKRQRDLLLSLGVEVLLGIAIVFLVIGVRRMQKLAEQKMQFVAAVSHELRTPVSAISMLSRNQADGLVTGTDKVQQYGELMHQQSRRLNEMVEQTLQYAGIHSNLGRPAKTEIDLKRLINEAVDARREELSRRGFEVEVMTTSDLPVVHGDAKLLRIAIDNLLSNAEKYADGGRWIRVAAKYATADKEVQISVEDRGAGIPEADRSEIFEPFSRGQAAIDAQIPGSGIGLSLVRSAVEAHHGTVTLVSEPGRGSTFTLHLPV